MMTDTGFYVLYRVGYNLRFDFIKLLDPIKDDSRAKTAAFVNRSILKWLYMMTGHEF